MPYDRYTDIYIHINGKISIDITCVGLAPARPNYWPIPNSRSDYRCNNNKTYNIVQLHMVVCNG